MICMNKINSFYFLNPFHEKIMKTSPQVPFFQVAPSIFFKARRQRQTMYIGKWRLEFSFAFSNFSIQFFQSLKLNFTLKWNQSTWMKWKSPAFLFSVFFFKINRKVRTIPSQNLYKIDDIHQFKYLLMITIEFYYFPSKKLKVKHNPVNCNIQ